MIHIEFWIIYGHALSSFVVTALVVAVWFFLNITWQCGSCGKTNKTDIIKYMLQWCDHQGDFR